MVAGLLDRGALGMGAGSTKLYLLDVKPSGGMAYQTMSQKGEGEPMTQTQQM